MLTVPPAVLTEAVQASIVPDLTQLWPEDSGRALYCTVTPRLAHFSFRPLPIYIPDFSLATGLLGCSLQPIAALAQFPSGLCPFVSLQGTAPASLWRELSGSLDEVQPPDRVLLTLC